MQEMGLDVELKHEERKNQKHIIELAKA